MFVQRERPPRGVWREREEVESIILLSSLGTFSGRGPHRTTALPTNAPEPPWPRAVALKHFVREIGAYPRVSGTFTYL